MGIAALLFCGQIGGAAIAQEPQAPTRHPVIGDILAKDLKASEVLALPDIERMAWVHGAVTMFAQAVAAHDPETSGCISGWYSSKSVGQQRIFEAMTLYPDVPATSVVYAVSRHGCPSL